MVISGRKLQGVRNYRAQLAAIPTERAPTADASGNTGGNAEQESEPLRVGVEADWYTLGTLMFELFVGHAPFQAGAFGYNP